MTCTSAARRARTMRLLVALAQCACSSRSHNALACRAPNPPPRTAVHDCRNVQGAHGGLKHGLPRSPTQPRPPRPHPRRLGDRRLDIAASATGGSTSPPRRYPFPSAVVATHTPRRPQARRHRRRSESGGWRHLLDEEPVLLVAGVRQHALDLRWAVVGAIEQQECY